MSEGPVDNGQGQEASGRRAEKSIVNQRPQRETRDYSETEGKDKENREMPTMPENNFPENN